MTELYEAVNSIYCYQNSNTLVNKLDIHDNKKLATVEKKLVLLKLYTLMQNKNIGNFDIHHFLSIHKFLFEDIYPFAGKIRSEDIAKDSFRFAKWEYIEEQLRFLFDKLSKDNFKNLSKEEMAKKLAYVNGYSFDVKNVSPKEMLNASIESIVNATHLEDVISRCLTKL